MDAKAFYGSAYTAHRSENLDKAFKWLMKAIQFEAEGDASVSKMTMAFNAALKAEADAFA